jgi:transposase-like protein
MILQVLHCPHCQGTDIVRHGQTKKGKQRYRCREERCAGRTFLREHSVILTLSAAAVDDA